MRIIKKTEMSGYTKGRRKPSKAQRKVMNFTAACQRHLDAQALEPKKIIIRRSK